MDHPRTSATAASPRTPHQAEAPARILVRVTTACGNSWESGFNGTLAEAQAHFMGQRFERMVPAKNAFGQREHLQEPVVSVVAL